MGCQDFRVHTQFRTVSLAFMQERPKVDKSIQTVKKSYVQKLKEQKRMYQDIQRTSDMREKKAGKYLPPRK